MLRFSNKLKDIHISKFVKKSAKFVMKSSKIVFLLLLTILEVYGVSKLIDGIADILQHF